MGYGIISSGSGNVSAVSQRWVPVVVGIGIFCIVSLVWVVSSSAQHSAKDRTPREKTVYVDEDGVMRFQGSDKKVVLFGVNYSVPFAHEFRMLNRLGYDHKKQIDRDVYHMARMGVDAFRMHIWDTEITDSLGNLLENKHLELLDYLVWKLKQRDIKIILTPITYYDNGYPEPPTSTPGFANYISKEEAPRNRKYWPVIKRYLSQFIQHENPYSETSYRQDPDIIALEIVNEPDHEDTSLTTEFVNVMASHLRGQDWEKPIFYNIAQNPSVAAEVMRADIDGVSFQWYPAGLVGGSEFQKNYLPYIDQYSIPFADKPGMQSKARMVYEFSPADVSYSYPYAVMARSFREAGFQFATQFAYDALAMADINTAYRTHYLNLAYTPSKAIGFRIASAVFHNWPRSKAAGAYPADTTFGNFWVSHTKDRAVLNADTAFYYTGTIEEQPKNAEELKHVAGVGSSPVVSYPGTGAYFLDKLEDGVWRLEVMPDAVPMYDPFAVTAMDKKLVHINWQSHPVEINLPDLGDAFRIRGLNEGNVMDKQTKNRTLKIMPGAYLLVKKGQQARKWTAESTLGGIRLGEFVAPETTSDKPHVYHKSPEIARSGESVAIEAAVSGVDSSDDVHLALQWGWQPTLIEMKEVKPYRYQADIPDEYMETGFLNYWITVQGEVENVTFPGGYTGFPGDWDYYHEDQWSIEVIADSQSLQIFRAKEHHSDLEYAFRYWNSKHRAVLVPSTSPGEMATKVRAGGPTQSLEALGWSFSIAGRWRGNKFAANDYDKLGIRARADSLQGARIKVILVDRAGISYSTTFSAEQKFRDIRLPFNAFQPDSMMLLPRPYPVFLPLWFRGEEIGSVQSEQIEQVQFLLEPAEDETLTKGASFAVESVWLE